MKRFIFFIGCSLLAFSPAWASPTAGKHHQAKPAASETSTTQPTATPESTPQSPSAAVVATASEPTVAAVAPVVTYEPVSPLARLGRVFDRVKMALPNLPLSGQTILPSIHTVYPTGEKPLVVVNFKCPAELTGVQLPPMKALHGLVNLGMDAVNKTDLLSYNLQQVCS